MLSDTRYFAYPATLAEGKVILTLCSFENCKAGIAGAIWVAGKGHLDLYATSFLNNQDILAGDATGRRILGSTARASLRARLMYMRLVGNTAVGMEVRRQGIT